MAILMPPVDAAVGATAVARAIARADPTIFTGKPGMFFLRNHREWPLTGGEARPPWG
jgi:hypothetical protein